VGKGKKLRRLALGAQTYRWKVEHKHHVLAPPTVGDGRQGRCREVFSALMDGQKASPLRVWFSDGEGAHAGYPEAGVVWTEKHRANLNEPGVARRLIELGLELGWCATDRGKPFVIEDGFAYLEELILRPSR
jgi:hypothetical protein